MIFKQNCMLFSDCAVIWLISLLSVLPMHLYTSYLLHSIFMPMEWILDAMEHKVGETNFTRLNYKVKR